MEEYPDSRDIKKIETRLKNVDTINGDLNRIIISQITHKQDIAATNQARLDYLVKERLEAIAIIQNIPYYRIIKYETVKGSKQKMLNIKYVSLAPRDDLQTLAKGETVSSQSIGELLDIENEEALKQLLSEYNIKYPEPIPVDILNKIRKELG